MVGKGEVKCGKRVKGEATVEDGEKEVKVRVGNGEGRFKGEVKCGKRKGGREGLRMGKGGS